jgi:molybdopterin/thiamine biosynthesis adenylyltransferase
MCRIPGHCHPTACREATVGMHKALSAAEACRALNSSIQVETHLEGFTPANAGAAALLVAGCVWGREHAYL